MYRNSLILFIALLAMAFGTQAQQLAVKSFRSLPHDMDALQNYPLKDQNGEVCAIVKVQTTEKGFYFDIGTLGITKTVQKPGEIWVYMPHGAKRLTITHELFVPLRDYFFTEPIEEGVCYELVLASGRSVTTIVPDEIETQWLIITSDPTGADVFIDDQPAGVTPYQSLLPLGKHSYRLQKPLYQNDAGMVELISGQQKKKVESKLRPNFGAVQVTTTPESGAAVLLNGMETGKTTPCTLERVPAGQHTLSASLNMYATTTQQITIQAGESLPVAINLKPSFSGVSINTIPAADIYVNGEMKGNGKWQGRLIPGVYIFEARLDKHTPATEQRTLVIGEQLALTLQPISRTGHLNVITNPMDASIQIEGKDCGTTPITLKNLQVGNYSVRLSLPGFKEKNQPITINEGETTTLNVNFTEAATTSQNSTVVSGQETVAKADLSPTDKSSDNDLILYQKAKAENTVESYLRYLNSYPNGKFKAEAQLLAANLLGINNQGQNSAPNIYTETVNGVSFEMLAVKGGTFQMGSNDGENNEKPVHPVILYDFYLGSTEVSQALWKAVMGKNPSNRKGDNLPVEQVSWNDAQEFITKLNNLTGKNYRLPTEAEWEYAAGGGVLHRTKYSGTNIESNLMSFAWFIGNSNGKTQPVGTKSSNWLGLYDMSGNVWEWCEDDWHADYQGAPVDGSAWIDSPRGSSRVLRGGSWFSYPSGCRAVYRGSFTPDYRDDCLGFRVVLVP